MLGVQLLYGAADSLGSGALLWAQALPSLVLLSIAAVALVSDRVAVTRSGLWAAGLAVALCLHGALVGVPYLALITLSRLLSALVLFGLLARESTARSASLDRVLAVVTLTAAVVGLVQLAAGPDMPRSWADPTRHRALSFRIASLFANPNLFGAYLAMVVPLHTARYVGGPAGGGAWLDGMAAALGLAFGIYTFSRGAWLSLSAGLGTLLLLKWSGRWVLQAPTAGLDRARARLLLVAAILALGGAWAAVGERLAASRDSAELGRAQRLTLARSVVAGIAVRPLAGWGLGSFNTAYPVHRLHGGYYPKDAHSSILHMAFEAGIPVALLMVGWWLASLRSGLRHRFTGPDGSGLAGAVGGLIGGAASLCLVGGVAYTQLELVWAAILARVAAGNGEARTTVPRLVGLPLAGVALLLVALWIQVIRVDTALARTTDPRSTLEWATREQPYRPDLWFSLGQARLRAGDSGGGLRALEEGHSRDPLQGRFLAERARVRVASRDLAGAIADATAALDTDPYCEEFLVLRAHLWDLGGQSGKAIQDLEAALAANPQYHSLNPETFLEAAQLLAQVAKQTGDGERLARARKLVQQLEVNAASAVAPMR